MSGTDLKQRLAAILAADAAGYSRLMSIDDRGTVAALDAARAVFRTQIEANRGRVIDMAGDSVLAVFDTASGAVTIPIRYGIKATMLLALFCAVLGVLASLVPYLRWGSWYISGILPVDGIILFACIKAVMCTTPSGVKVSGASTLLKAGMFSSLVVFTLSAILL